jgi:hypothetical protein
VEGLLNMMMSTDFLLPVNLYDIITDIYNEEIGYMYDLPTLLIRVSHVHKTSQIIRRTYPLSHLPL